jgi:uncharacterized protein YbjT (DUF2867 family)
MSKLCAIVAGATGVVGRHCVQRLLADPDFSQVNVIARRHTGLRHPKLVEHIVDFDDLSGYSERHPEAFNADAAFCCLGTTMRVAGSRPAFERVDYHYVHQFAELAAKHKVPVFMMISAVGANPHSPVYYSRIKGKVEQAVRELSFRSVHIMRPSLLLGHREDSRPAEAIAQRIAPLISPFMVGPLARYKPVSADAVAAEMVSLSKRADSGAFVHHSE